MLAAPPVCASKFCFQGKTLTTKSSTEVLRMLSKVRQLSTKVHLFKVLNIQGMDIVSARYPAPMAP